MPVVVKYCDLFRAALDRHCGNVGFLGFAPDGSAYHVVVPVDARVARGVKAGNRPADGTPFGGYRDWRYFECPPFAADMPEGRRVQTEKNVEILSRWADAQGFELVVEK
jgi:hypothetical protein